MLEKVPPTPNDSNAIRPSGIQIQPQTPTDHNSQKKNDSCC